MGASLWSMTGTPWEPPSAGTEETQLIGALERMRTTFRFKADGLDAAGLSQRIGASSLTLGGLLKHLAICEDNRFTVKYEGSPLPEPWAAVDWDADPDWEFRTAADDPPLVLYALWDDAVERSRQRLAAALAKDGGLDQRVAANWNGEHASLRRLVTDFIEEYGRHTGHADLLREAVDGVTGEDPPDDWRPVSGSYRVPGVAG
jgi:sulfur carrier protein ThiS